MRLKNALKGIQIRFQEVIDLSNTNKHVTGCLYMNTLLTAT